MTYKRSAAVDGAVLLMEAPFLLYDFSSGLLYGFADGGRYHGCRMDGLSPRRELAFFPKGYVVWI